MTETVTEAVQRIPFSELHPFEGHPFKVRDDEAMTEITESIFSNKIKCGDCGC